MNSLCLCGLAYLLNPTDCSSETQGTEFSKSPVGSALSVCHRLNQWQPVASSGAGVSPGTWRRDHHGAPGSPVARPQCGVPPCQNTPLTTMKNRCTTHFLLCPGFLLPPSGMAGAQSGL